jgi:hypothetical protein
MNRKVIYFNEDSDILFKKGGAPNELNNAKKIIKNAAGENGAEGVNETPAVNKPTVGNEIAGVNETTDGNESTDDNDNDNNDNDNNDNDNDNDNNDNDNNDNDNDNDNNDNNDNDNDNDDNEDNDNDNDDYNSDIDSESDNKSDNKSEGEGGGDNMLMKGGSTNQLSNLVEQLLATNMAKISNQLISQEGGGENITDVLSGIRNQLVNLNTNIGKIIKNNALRNE